MKILYSAHLNEPKENIGDLFSAYSLSILYGNSSSIYHSLQENKKGGAKGDAIYGGGGMIRPHFAKREVFSYYSSTINDGQFAICGVGLNKDEMTADFSSDDLCALKEWINSASIVSVRDLETKLFLETYLDYGKAYLAPCPTYPVLKRLKLPKEGMRKKFRLGVVPSFGHTETYRSYLANTIAFTKSLIDIFGQRNVCIICHDMHDYHYAHSLFYKSEVSVFKPCSLNQLKYVYSNCEKVISFRGHGVIFSAACGIPCSAVALNIKLETLFHFHYGISNLQHRFEPLEHISFLNETILPKNVDVPSESALFN